MIYRKWLRIFAVEFPTHHYMVIPLTIQHFDILPSNRVHSKLRVRNFSVYDINKYTNGAMSEQPKPDLSHHKQLEYCTNRLKYRDGHRQTAVKVIALNYVISIYRMDEKMCILAYSRCIP